MRFSPAACLMVLYPAVWFAKQVVRFELPAISEYRTSLLVLSGRRACGPAFRHSAWLVHLVNVTCVIKSVSWREKTNTRHSVMPLGNEEPPWGPADAVSKHTSKFGRNRNYTLCTGMLLPITKLAGLEYGLDMSLDFWLLLEIKREIFPCRSPTQKPKPNK